LRNTAWKQIYDGNLTAALKIAEKGLNKFPDPTSENHWIFLTLKAEILMQQGRYEESLALLDVSIPEKLANSQMAVWQKLTQGSALAYLGTPSQAEAYLRDAQAKAAASQQDLVGEALIRLGTLASLQRNFEQAQSFYHSSLEFARLHHNAFLEVAALGNLGLEAARMEHYDESVQLNEQALQLAQKNGWLAAAARIEGNIGFNQYLVGDLLNAQKSFAKAGQQDIDAGLPERRITWLNGEGDVYYDLRDYVKAESKSTEALKLADSLHKTDDAIDCLQNLALISLARNQLEVARKYIDDALGRDPLAPDRARDLYSRLIAADLYSRTGDLAKSESLYNEILSDPESHKSQSFLWEARAGLAQTHAAQGKLVVAEREFQSSIATISAARASIKLEDFRLSFLTNAIRFYHQYVKFLIDQKRPADALKIADLSRSQTLESGLRSRPDEKGRNDTAKQLQNPTPPPLNPEKIAARLNATILFYWLGQDSSYLWVITPSRTNLYSLAPSEEIDAAVYSYRDFILKDPRDPLESGNRNGKKLYEMLVGPVEKEISRNSRVIILPDGALRSLNFESLPIFDSKPRYWIEDVTISIANSLSLLSSVQNSVPPKDPTLLLFGDPDPPSAQYPRLGDAEKEVGSILEYFPQNRRSTYRKKEATVSNYLSSDPGKYSYIHFGTHGVASLSEPLESAIILSREGDSYKLFARDILQHPLNSYLVSISACDGVGQRNFAGEGLIGLSWGFLRAGSRHVVAALWEVSTSSTQIMGGLYKGLKEGEDPGAALRNAKLSMLHSKEMYHRPFYWAPFQLYLGS
jgi:CHAT domain-containing protein